jgi:AcrR family transcriptional regulator
MVGAAALPAPALRVPVQARALRTRAALLAAAERELSERGHQATTAQSIAARAGVATGSFYQYFADKDAALRELATSRLHALEVRLLALGPLRPTELPRDPRRPVLAILDAVLDYHREDRGLHAVLTERRHVDAELDRLTHASEQRMVQHLTELLAALGVRGDVQARAFVVYGLVEGCVHAHVLATPMLSDERLRQSLCDALLAVAFAPSASTSTSTAKRTRSNARSKKTASKR